MYMYIYMYRYMHTHTYVQTHRHICTHQYIYIYAHIHIHGTMYVYTYKHTCTHIYIDIQEYMQTQRMLAHTHIYIRAYVSYVHRYIYHTHGNFYMNRVSLSPHIFMNICSLLFPYSFLLFHYIIHTTLGKDTMGRESLFSFMNYSTHHTTSII